MMIAHDVDNTPDPEHHSETWQLDYLSLVHTFQNDVDNADRECESSRMADVYRNSHLTMTPTWADSPTVPDLLLGKVGLSSWPLK